MVNGSTTAQLHLDCSVHGLAGTASRKERQCESYGVYGRGNVLDLIFIGLTVLFFLLALAYVRGCEKLQ